MYSINDVVPSRRCRPPPRPAVVYCHHRLSFTAARCVVSRCSLSSRSKRWTTNVPVFAACPRPCAAVAASATTRRIPGVPPRRSSRRVAGLVAVAIEERSGEDHSSSYFVIAACPRHRPDVAAYVTTRRCRPSFSPLLRTLSIVSCRRSRRRRDRRGHGRGAMD